MKVSVLHMEIRNTLEDNLTAAKTAVLKAAKQKPALIALPEYFTVPNCMADFTNAQKISRGNLQQNTSISSKKSPKQSATSTSSAVQYLQEDSGKYYNTSTLWRNGKLLAKYKKINPIKAEVEAGVAKGSTPLVVDTELGKLGMIVCADTFDPPLVKKVADLGAEIVSSASCCNGNSPNR